MRLKITTTYPEEEFIFADGFDDCIIGLDEGSMRVVYSIGRCIDKVLSWKGIATRGEAETFFYMEVYNVSVEHNCPMFIREYNASSYIEVYLN